MISNSIIIISAIVAIVIVHKRSYKKGVQDGRIQILEEDLIRNNHKSHDVDLEMMAFIQHHKVNDNYHDIHSQIQAAKRKHRIHAVA